MLWLWLSLVVLIVLLAAVLFWKRRQVMRWWRERNLLTREPKKSGVMSARRSQGVKPQDKHSSQYTKRVFRTSRGLRTYTVDPSGRPITRKIA